MRTAMILIAATAMCVGSLCEMGARAMPCTVPS